MSKLPEMHFPFSSVHKATVHVIYLYINQVPQSWLRRNARILDVFGDVVARGTFWVVVASETWI